MTTVPFILKPYPDPDMEPLDIKISGEIIPRKQQIDIHYKVVGNITDIRFPPASRSSTRRDQLWQTTCFEFFTGPKDSSAYWEYNLSPSGDWAVFRFVEYRTGKTDEYAITSIDINTSTDGIQQYELSSSIPLPANLATKRLDCGVSLVLQQKNGGIYYYALDHLKRQPDFHDRDSFTISIDI